MPKKQHTEAEIISALKQYEFGEKTTDICRKLGVSQATFYMWKKQYAGLGVQELRELRNLREDNGRLKRIVASIPIPDNQFDAIVFNQVMEHLPDPLSVLRKRSEFPSGPLSGMSLRMRSWFRQRVRIVEFGDFVRLRRSGALSS
jgi:putative transposase